jgi:DOPA 4,5-dioxygenase
MSDVAAIAEYHAHVYFSDADTSARAAAVREELGARFGVEIGRWHDEPAGPHPCGMYEVKFTPEQFGAIVPWLMLNRDGLRVLVHPMTGDDMADHTANPMWLGEPLALDLAVLASIRRK